MKKKLIPLIISAVLFLAGCGSIIVGIFVNNGAFSKYPELDPFSISDADVGKTFSGRLFAGSQLIETNEDGRLYLLNILASTDEESADVTVMCCDVPLSAGNKYDQSDYG